MSMYIELIFYISIFSEAMSYHDVFGIQMKSGHLSIQGMKERHSFCNIMCKLKSGRGVDDNGLRLSVSNLLVQHLK